MPSAITPDRGGLHQQVGQIRTGEEVGVEGLEDGPDDGQAGDDRYQAEVTAAYAGDAGAEVGGDAGVGAQPLVLQVGGQGGGHRSTSSVWVGSVLVGGIGGCRGGIGLRPAVWASRRRLTALSVAPVMAAMISSVDTSADDELAVVAAQPQHDDPVGDGLDVLHVVADQHHGEAALAQPFDQVQHLGGLGHAQRGGRFVQDDELGLAEQRPGDGHGLALAAGQRGDGDPDGRDLGRELTQQLPGADLHPDLVEAEPALLATQEEVLHHIEVVAERQVLEDGGDAPVERGHRGGQADVLARRR